MALTQIRKEQIKDYQITDAKVASDAAISYSKLNLANSIDAGDLNPDGSLAQSVLDSKVIGLWDMVKGISSGTASSLAVTTEITEKASVDTSTKAATVEGVLLTGTGTDGAGVQNYKVQIVNSATGEPIADETITGDINPAGDTAGNVGTVYGELRHNGSNYTLYFFKSNGSAYTFATSIPIDFMFVEIFTYQTAPAMGFVTGMGFADVVGITGSHNHHDLYYTQTELNGGQLDNRYYTETEIGGFLSGKSDTTHLHDDRYYTETELGGSGGAALIGVNPTPSGYTTVQGGIDGLDTRLDTLETAGGVIQSLDAAYADGSVIDVGTIASGRNATNVDWRLTDTKSFKVTDSTGAAGILVATANSAGDTVAVTGGFDVTGDTTLDKTNIVGAFDVTGDSTLDKTTIDGNLAQSTGTVVLNATGIMDLDASGAATLNAASIALTSTSTLSVKDSILTAAINFTESGAKAPSALHNKFINTSPTDFDWTRSDTAPDNPTSIIGAINANRSDIYQYVELIGTQGAGVGVAAGANLIGVDGITGIIPTGHTVGANSTLQEMLEGLALAGGSVKSYANQGDFTTAKGSGTYLPVDTLVFIKDTNRFIRVLVSGTTIQEGIDWDYLWDASNPMGGVAFNVTSDAITFDTAGTLTLDGATSVVTTSAGAVTFKDQYLTTALPLSQATVTALSTNLTASSIIGAINENADDLNTLIVTTLPATADGSAGADKIGVTGITGITPTGGTLGTAGTVQSMLEGIAIGAGGVKTYATTGDFTTDKAGGAYLPVGTLVYLTDIARFAQVTLVGTGVVEDTDYSIVWGTALPMKGADFVVDTSDDILLTSIGDFSLTSNSFKVADSNNLASIESIANANPLLNGQLIISGNNSLSILTSSGNDAAKVSIYSKNIDIDADKAITIDGASIAATAATNGAVTLNATGTGQIVLDSDAQVTVDAPLTTMSGNLTIPDNKWLSTGNIKITSVDPADTATISGSRTGVLAANLFTNPGFESGSGLNADNWTEGAPAIRSYTDRYYGSYSIFSNDGGNHPAANPIITQAMTGATPAGAYMVSLWFKGTTQSGIEAIFNGGTAVTVVPAGAAVSTWKQYSIGISPSTVTGDFIFQTKTGTTSDLNNFNVDAVKLETGSTVSDYFSSYKSELIFTIGDDNEDRIVFRSEGTATQDLVRINQSTVEVLGNLVVSGTTTTVNSSVVDIADNEITLNSNVTSGTPTLNASLNVKRGASPTTALRWNESTDKWELTNDGTTYYNIATSTGSGVTTMDSAYDGGSTVAVDNTNVAFTMAATKSFILADVTDTSKFVVTAGSGLDSVKIDTTGGLDIDADAGVTINGATVITGATQIIGAMNLDGAIDHDGASFSSNNSGGFDVTSTIFDVNASSDVTIDGTGVSIDGTAASNLTTTGANAHLTVSAAGTTSNVVISATGIVDIDAGPSVEVNATAINTNGILTQTGATNITGATIITGATQIIGAMNLDGAIDHNGTSFDSFSTGNALLSSVTTSIAGSTEVDLTAPTVDINGTTAVTIDGAAINTTGILTQVGNLAQSGGTVVLNATGIVDINSTTAVTVNAGTTMGLTSTGAMTLNGDGVSVFGFSGGMLLNTNTQESDLAADILISTTGVVASDINLSSNGDITFNDGRTGEIPFSDSGTGNNALPGGATSILGALKMVYDAADGANTLDEIYNEDGTTVATRVITQDLGTVKWNITDTYSHIFADSAGATILSANALSTGDTVVVNGTLDLNGPLTVDGATVAIALTGTAADSFKLSTAGGIDIDSANGIIITDDSGAAVTLSAAGAADVVGIAGQTATLRTASGAAFTTTSGEADITATNVDINGITTIDGSTIGLTGVTTQTGAFEVVGASTLDGVTMAGDLIQSGGAVTLTATGAVDIDATVASSFMVTGASLTLGTITSGELYFDDARTAAISFSDAGTGNNVLPTGANSILGAIKMAYEKSIDMSYEEPTPDTTNDLVVILDVDSLLPGSGTYTPTALRTSGVHIAIYLNGLRLNDSEWNYVYDGTLTRKTIVFSGIDLISGDVIAVEVKKIG